MYKMILSALTFLLMASAANAGSMTKVQAHEAAIKAHPKEMKIIDEAREKYEKTGKLEDMPFEKRRELQNAYNTVAAIPKGVAMEAVSVKKISMSMDKNIVETIVRLNNALENGTPAEKEAAKAQLELINVIGKKLDSNNFNKPAAEGLKVLMSLDLLSLPEAVPVVQRVLAALKDGKSYEEAMDKKITGLKGTLEEFIRLCKDQGFKV